MSGLKNKIGFYLEKIFGGTDGRIHLPIEIRLGVSMDGSASSQRKVRAKAHALIASDSNYKDAISPVRSEIESKIEAFNTQVLKAQKLEKSVDEIVQMTGFEPTSIEFSREADIIMTAKLKSVAALFPNLKLKALQSQAEAK